LGLDMSIAKLGDGVTVSARDVTARKQGEIELQRAKAEAEAANAAKDRFLATLSHELRTPLTPALAIASALEHDERRSASVREQAATIRRNIELEARLIDDILDLTRVAQGKLALKFQFIDIKPLIEHTLAMFRD